MSEGKSGGSVASARPSTPPPSNEVAPDAIPDPPSSGSTPFSMAIDNPFADVLGSAGTGAATPGAGATADDDNPLLGIFGAGDDETDTAAGDPPTEPEETTSADVAEPSTFSMAIDNPFADILGSAGTGAATPGAGATADDDNPLLALFGGDVDQSTSTTPSFATPPDAEDGHTNDDGPHVPSADAVDNPLLEMFEAAEAPGESTGDEPAFDAMWMPLDTPPEPESVAESSSEPTSIVEPTSHPPSDATDDDDDIDARAAMLLARLSGTSASPGDNDDDIHPDFVIPTLSDEPEVEIVADDIGDSLADLDDETSHDASPPDRTDSSDDPLDVAAPAFDEDTSAATDDDVAPAHTNTDEAHVATIPEPPQDTPGSPAPPAVHSKPSEVTSVAPQAPPRARRNRPARPPWQSAPPAQPTEQPQRAETQSGETTVERKAPHTFVAAAEHRERPQSSPPAHPAPPPVAPLPSAQPYPAAPDMPAPQRHPSIPAAVQQMPGHPVHAPAVPGRPHTAIPDRRAPSAPPRTPSPQHTAKERPTPVSPNVTRVTMPMTPVSTQPPQTGGSGHVSSTHAPTIEDAHHPVQRSTAPHGGWRRAVHAASAGRLNLGDSRTTQRQRELVERARIPIRGDFRIAVLSMKGGVGKTTTTIGLGSTFASIRGDRVIALDANPDRGNLADRVSRTTDATVRDLLNMGDVRHYSRVSNLTSTAPSRLEVLSSEQDPAAAEAFDESDYRRTMDCLRQFYNIILTDCGTGIMHSAMSGILDFAHAVVLVTTPAPDAARSASATLDWLNLHGYAHLAQGAHVVLSSSRPSPPRQVDVDAIVEHFSTRCRTLHYVPFDQVLAEGGVIDMPQLNTNTRQAYLELAGAALDGFQARHHQPGQQRMEA